MAMTINSTTPAIITPEQAQTAPTPAPPGYQILVPVNCGLFKHGFQFTALFAGSVMYSIIGGNRRNSASAARRLFLRGRDLPPAAVVVRHSDLPHGGSGLNAFQQRNTAGGKDVNVREKRAVFSPRATRPVTGNAARFYPSAGAWQDF